MLITALQCFNTVIYMINYNSFILTEFFMWVSVKNVRTVVPIIPGSIRSSSSPLFCKMLIVHSSGSPPGLYFQFFFWCNLELFVRRNTNLSFRQVWETLVLCCLKGVVCGCLEPQYIQLYQCLWISAK